MKKNIEKMGLDNLPKYTPEASLWNGIEEELNQDKKRRIVWWPIVSGIAASLIIAFFWVNLSSEKNTSDNTAQIIQETPELSYPTTDIDPTMDGIDASADKEIVDIGNTIQEKQKNPLGSKASGENVVFLKIQNEPLASTITFTNNNAIYNTGNGVYLNSQIGIVSPNTYSWTPNTIELQNVSSYYSNDHDYSLGNVTLPLNGSLITGGQNLFGIKTQTQYNKSDVKGFSDGHRSFDRLRKDGNLDGDGVEDYFDSDLDQVYQGTLNDTISFGFFDFPQSDYNSETYAEQIENDFTTPYKEPLSTFAIDVDNASYAIMRSKLTSQQLVPKNSVRIEEFINYFSYDYKAPTQKPFSINTEMAQCPWNTQRQLVHIGLQGKKIDYENTEASNLVFLLDVSGSMSNENKLPLVKKSMNMLVEKMGSKDKIAIVTYAGAAGLALESTSCDKKDYIAKKIKRLESGGSTAGGAGIKLAYKVALDNFIKEGNNRIILCTDGDFNVGESSNGAMEDLIVSYRDKGVFITVCGFGMGNYQDSKMETIADNGNGNYFYIDTYREADKVFNRELRATLFTIAKDVKIQVEFNPAYVKAYRLIGYENRIMPAQDFNDDTKDGGELGAGHTVTALYEIIPANSKENFEDIDPLKYQKVGNKESLVYNNEAITVKLRYKEPKESVSKLLTYSLKPSSMDYRKTSENFRFSAGVALFASTLRQSKYTDDTNFTKSLDLVKNASTNDPNEDRAQLIELMIKAQQTYGAAAHR